MKFRHGLSGVFARLVRKIIGQLIWTRPEIAATFRAQPQYLKKFKEVWLAFMWGQRDRRALREAVAVTISAANLCTY